MSVLFSCGAASENQTLRSGYGGRDKKQHHLLVHSSLYLTSFIALPWSRKPSVRTTTVSTTCCHGDQLQSTQNESSTPPNGTHVSVNIQDESRQQEKERKTKKAKTNETRYLRKKRQKVAFYFRS